VVYPPIDSNLPSSMMPGQQVPFSPTLRSIFPGVISGQITMSFTPGSAVAIVQPNDPLPEFSNGLRTVNFTIPANSTTVILDPPAVMLIGTVSGTVQLTSIIQGSASVIGAMDILAVPPQIIGVDATRSSSDVTIRTTGFASIRSVTSVTFSFEVRTSSGAQTINLTRNVDGDFTAWYKDAASANYGSTFQFSQSFSVQGDASSLEAVTVTLANTLGSVLSSRTLIKVQ